MMASSEFYLVATARIKEFSKDRIKDAVIFQILSSDARLPLKRKSVFIPVDKMLTGMIIMFGSDFILKVFQVICKFH